MKKVLLFASVLIGINLSLQAQNHDGDDKRGWYIKPYVGYFLSVTPVEYPSIGGLPSRDRVFTINSQTQQQATISEEILKGSFGQGLRIGLAGGYRFNQILGLEVGLNYYRSETQTMSKQQATFLGTSTTALSLSATGQVTAFDVAPALVFYIPNPRSNVFKPYGKVGVIVPVGGQSKNITNITDNTGTVAISQGILKAADLQAIGGAMAQAGITGSPLAVLSNVSRVDETKSNPTIGFQSALGADFWLGKRVSINVEIEYRNVTVASKSRELQSISGTLTFVNSTTLQPLPDALAAAIGPISRQLTMESASESSKKINYHDKINSTDHNIVASGSYDPNLPADEVSNRLTFGGLGINIGLKFRL